MSRLGRLSVRLPRWQPLRRGRGQRPAGCCSVRHLGAARPNHAHFPHTVINVCVVRRDRGGTVSEGAGAGAGAAAPMALRASACKCACVRAGGRAGVCACVRGRLRIARVRVYVRNTHTRAFAHIAAARSRPRRDDRPRPGPCPPHRCGLRCTNGHFTVVRRRRERAVPGRCSGRSVDPMTAPARLRPNR